jgi:hypothetical protein
MDDQISDLRARLYISCLVILVFGLLGAALIYLTAEDEQESAAGYVMIDGKAYPIPPGSSKVYVRDLQRFGGKSAVLFDELNRWFAGLWQGKSLAVTLAWISVFASLGVFLVARRLPAAAPKEKSPGES